MSDDPALFTTVLVGWGRGGRALLPRLLDTDYGPVVVTAGRDLTDWLSNQGRAGLSSDEVEALVTDLETTANQREAAQAPTSWWIRWLARVR